MQRLGQVCRLSPPLRVYIPAVANCGLRKLYATQAGESLSNLAELLGYTVRNASVCLRRSCSICRCTLKLFTTICGMCEPNPKNALSSRHDMRFHAHRAHCTAVKRLISINLRTCKLSTLVQLVPTYIHTYFSAA